MTDYLSEVVKNSKIVFDKIVALKCKHEYFNDPTYEKMISKKKVTCAVSVSSVLQLSGLLKPGDVVSHTERSGGDFLAKKNTIEKAVLGYKNLISGTYDIYRVGSLYKNLPDKYKVAGAVYVQDSNICISAGSGKIYSTNKGSAQYKDGYVKDLVSSGYPFDSKIIYVIMPKKGDGVKMTYKINDKAIALIKEFEGCRLTAYQDVVNVWTIGYGITNADKAITGTTIKKGLTISQATADAWLMKSLNSKYLPKVTKYAERYNFNENEIGALVSFAFNIGSIDALVHIDGNTSKGYRTKAQIADAMLLYNKAGGKVYAGLTRRRKAERELFLSPIGPKVIPKSYPLSTLRKGSTGKDVTLFETILSKMGYYSGSIDEKYGDGCVKACKAFQGDYDLDSDGIAGPKTWSKALSLLSA